MFCHALPISQQLGDEQCVTAAWAVVVFSEPCGSADAPAVVGYALLKPALNPL
jgi:hypothetical protein